MARGYLGAPCADCGVGTFTLGEWYMVKDEVWDQAWIGRRKPWHGRVPGQEILCIGCLEQRLGRTLMCCDFTDAPINDSNQDNISERMRDRLTAKEGTMKGESIFDYLAKRMIRNMPPDEREAVWLLWKN
jgi:hypothetical protein